MMRLTILWEQSEFWQNARKCEEMVRNKTVRKYGRLTPNRINYVIVMMLVYNINEHSESGKRPKNAGKTVESRWGRNRSMCLSASLFLPSSTSTTTLTLSPLCLRNNNSSHRLSSLSPSPFSAPPCLQV